MRALSSCFEATPYVAQNRAGEGRRYRLRVDDLADYLDTFMKRARREAQPKDAKGQKD